MLGAASKRRPRSASVHAVADPRRTARRREIRRLNFVPAPLDLNLALKKAPKLEIYLKGPVFVVLQKNCEHAQPSAKEPFR